MKKSIISIFFIILLSTLLFPKNLTLHDYNDPSAHHILDADIQDDLLVVSGMIGGIEFYDISNSQVLNHLDNLTLSGGGGGGGQGGGTKPHCIKLFDDYAYVTTNRGLGIINISNPNNPQYLGIVSGTNNYILENLDVLNDILVVAAHEDGILIYDVSNPSNPSYITTIDTENSWTATLNDNILYVADEQILEMYSISNGFSYLNSIELSNAIKDIAINSNVLYVAIGSDGVVAYNIEQESNITLIDAYNTSAMANKLATFDYNKVAVSDWDDVEILETNFDDAIDLVGYKNTTRRTMAIATKDNYIYSAEWAAVQVFEYGEISGPDIDLNTYELNYPYVPNSDSYTMSLEITNNGNSILNIIDAYTTNNEFSYSELNDLYPGETQVVDIVYSANSNNSSGSYRILTNDNDEPEIICETNGNINGANIGDVAPNFELDIIANGVGSFQLSDYIGKIIVLAFFAPN
ncbi:MAG: hypothetical protein CMG64_04880 [Candidatus Marinimicrobia bacterium]|nr:hypothetical protein [Candidatus Neomarinimicrobiota bacterium]|tara:strand:- start:4117 stop:5511 length:1395 start_codon:yes stop_codon:yes gene_type:complete